MTIFNKDLLCVAIASLVLTGCGGSDNNDATTEKEEHDHEGSIFISQTNTDTLSLLEEDGTTEPLDDAAAGNGATLVLSGSGAYAAVQANGTINFVHGLHEEEEEGEEEAGEEHEEEAHVLDFSLTGSQVISTNGHFGVLDFGTTTFVAYDELENTTPATEDTSALSVTETYPALIIDEEHELQIVFDGTNALVFEDGTQEESYTCSNPTSHGQTAELVVVSCGAGAMAITIEEDAMGEHTFGNETLTLDGNAEDYIWRAKGDVIVGFEPNTSNYAIMEFEGTLEMVKGSETETFAFTQNICDMQLESESQDVLAIAAAGQFVALNHEGEALKQILLDESVPSNCGNIVLGTGAKLAIVADNAAQKAYEIDVDKPETDPNSYHVHIRFDFTVDDIKDMVIFHEMDGEGHSHDD